jgi:hypothetical protein
MATHTRLTTTLLTLTLLTGCTQTSPTPPTPEPSPTCTPEAGGTPYPCTHAEHQQMTTKNNLYTQAETVYRQFFAEDQRIYRAGGITDPTPALLESTTGAFLADSMRIYKALKATKTKVIGDSFVLAWIKREPGPATASSVVTMRSCVDASAAILRSPGEPDQSAGMTSDLLFFAQEKGRLKIQSADGKVVEKC